MVPAPRRARGSSPLTFARMSSSPTSPPSTPSASVGGLLVVSIDRLPAWMLSSYGATWVSTPAFDGLAAAGITFDRLLATDVDPRATLADLMGRGLLWRAAAAAGRPAVIVTDDRALPERPPGVDIVEVPTVPASTPAADDEGTNIARLCAQARDIVSAGGHGLVWCHAGSLGVAWDAPLAYRAAYVDPEDPPPPAGAGVPHFAVTADTDPDAVMGCRQAFAGQLTLLDRCVGGVVAAARGLPRPWAVAVVGLRGMPLGLHGQVGCGPDGNGAARPYGEWAHLPAIIAAADGRMAGQRDGGLATPADVGATLVDLVAAGAAPAPDGRSLAGLFADWSRVPRDRVLVSAADSAAIVTRAWHLVAERLPDGTRSARLFAKPDDYFELSDVADRCPGVAEELAAALEPGREAAPLSPAALGG